MRTISLSGSPRAGVGKKESVQLRNEGKIPCILYGKAGEVRFWAYGYDVNKILGTEETFIINVEVDGKSYQSVLQESQIHPVNNSILHADFLMLEPGKAVRVGIPLEYTGSAPGVRVGGKFTSRVRKLMISALPENLPSSIKVDISHLELGKSIRVKEIVAGNYTILASPNNPICSIVVPRSMRGKAATTA
jgi:large subunit ribosomal protein L25